MTNLILVSAFPGSGKTYTSKFLNKDLKFNLISTSEVRHNAGMYPPYSGEDFSKGYLLFYDHIADLVSKGKDVIGEATFNAYENRVPFYNLSERFSSSLSLTIIRCVCPIEISKDRILNRKDSSDGIPHVKKLSTLERYVRNYKPIEMDLPVIENRAACILYDTHDHTVNLISSGKNPQFTEKLMNLLR